MIIQLDQLFINTEAIATLSPFEDVVNVEYETGLVINGIRYPLYRLQQGAPVEDMEIIKQNTLNLVSTIIKHFAITPVQKIVAAVQPPQGEEVDG